MIDKLRKLNPDIKLYSVRDPQFKQYGNVLKIDIDEFVRACEAIEMPETGSAYRLSVSELENLPCSDILKLRVIGGCDAQTGLCHGYNSYLNALEFHRSSEINVAITQMVLFLGLQYEMDGSEYDSAKVKAFYLEKGDVVEIFGTSMHFCPCQVSDEGFSCAVILPSGTNDVLCESTEDRLLFKKNKWLICHDKNESLIERGVYPGLHGENYQIRYK